MTHEYECKVVTDGIKTSCNFIDFILTTDLDNGPLFAVTPLKRNLNKMETKEVIFTGKSADVVWQQLEENLRIQNVESLDSNSKVAVFKWDGSERFGFYNPIVMSLWGDTADNVSQIYL